MSKPLPYFRWFPADAEIDEAYGSMTDEELGFFHRCLNKAWVNGGLPCEIAAIASLLKVSKKYFLKVWPKVSVKWERRGDRLVNPRQEIERQLAIEKGEKNKRPGNANATRENRERVSNAFQMKRDPNANWPQHAQARADSDSGSDFSGGVVVSFPEKENPDSVGAMKKRFDEWIAPWPRVPSLDKAMHAWAFCWTPEEDTAVFACRDRYLASKDVAEGVCQNPDRFLNEQKVSAWAGKWPSARDPPGHQQIAKTSRTKEIIDSL